MTSVISHPVGGSPQRRIEAAWISRHGRAEPGLSAVVRWWLASNGMPLRFTRVASNGLTIAPCHVRTDVAVAHTRARKTEIRLSDGPAAQSGGQKRIRRAQITQVGNLPGFYRHPPVSCAKAVRLIWEPPPTETPQSGCYCTSQPQETM